MIYRDENNKINIKKPKAIMLLILIILTAVVSYYKKISINYPDKVEEIYTRGIFPIVRNILVFLTGWIPFSLSEILIVISIILMITFLIIRTVQTIKKKQLLFIINYFINIAIFAMALLISFNFFWGYNYNKTQLKYILGYSEVNVAEDDLAMLYKELINSTNYYRGLLEEDEYFNATVYAKSDIYKKAKNGYLVLQEEYEDIFDGVYGRVKPLLFSRYQTITGIAGVYLPFLAEANVNFESPIFNIPHSACHEIAHQRGFAKEDEANYIGYLAAINNEDNYFKYSGYLFATIYVGNELAKIDPELYTQLHGLLDQGVQNDLTYQREFWAQYESKATEVGETINDSYLKANNQIEGVKSYGLVVDLLLAEYLNR